MTHTSPLLADADLVRALWGLLLLSLPGWLVLLATKVRLGLLGHIMVGPVVGISLVGLFGYLTNIVLGIPLRAGTALGISVAIAGAAGAVLLRRGARLEPQA